MKRRRTGSTAALAANRCCRCAASASASIPNVSKNPTCDEATKPSNKQTHLDATPTGHKLRPTAAHVHAFHRARCAVRGERWPFRPAQRHGAGAGPQSRRFSCSNGRDGTGRDGTGRDGTGRDGTGRDGTGRDGTGRDDNTTVTLCPRRVCVRISTAGGAAPPAARPASSRATAQRVH